MASPSKCLICCTKSSNTFKINRKLDLNSKKPFFKKPITLENLVPSLLNFICLLFEIDFDTIFATDNNEPPPLITLCSDCLKKFDSLYKIHSELRNVLQSIWEPVVKSSVNLSLKPQEDDKGNIFGGSDARCRQFRRQVCLSMTSEIKLFEKKTTPRRHEHILPMEEEEIVVKLEGLPYEDDDDPLEDVILYPDEQIFDANEVKEESIEYLKESQKLVATAAHQTRYVCTCRKNYNFKTKVAFERHIYLHKLGPIKKCYNCIYCSTESGDSYLMRNHESTTHKEELIHQCPDCHNKYGFEILLEMHQQIHVKPGNEQFICKLCQKEFTDRSLFRDHVNYTHVQGITFQKPEEPETPKNWVCEICKASYQNKSQHTEHVKNSHQTREEMECEFCDSKFLKNYSLIMHLINVHEFEDGREKSLKCSSCDKMFASKLVLERHQGLHKRFAKSLDKFPFFCKKCDLRHSSKTRLDQHVKSVHTKFDSKANEIECKECDLKFPRQMLMRHQWQAHPNLLVHCCDQCDQRYSSESFLETHKKTHGPPDANGHYMCLACSQNRKFATAEALSDHLKMHNGEERFTCAECSKTFWVKNAFENHMRSHNEEGKYKCLPCNKKYNNLNSYNNHLKTTHPKEGAEKLPCDQCDKHFYTRATLRMHKNRHKEKPKTNVQCHLCGASIKQLLHHMIRKHPEECQPHQVKKWSCYFCQKRFNTMFELREHMYIHSLERPYMCDQCPKDYNQKHCLTTHKKKLHPESGQTNSAKETIQKPKTSKKRKLNDQDKEQPRSQAHSSANVSNLVDASPTASNQYILQNNFIQPFLPQNMTSNNFGYNLRQPHEQYSSQQNVISNPYDMNNYQYY